MRASEFLLENYNIIDLPFYRDVVAAGGEIYQVGGAVRDAYLGLESKDLDILIRNISSEHLTEILKKYGNVNEVGKSFGVIKFKQPGKEEIDIALPRTEQKRGRGHRGFDVNVDPSLPLRTDLLRRDFTFNTIAKDSSGKIIDHYGGLQDIKNKIVRMANPAAFSEDPLRMLRAIQFATRFGFEIEPKTMKIIQDNAYEISDEPKERVLEELRKIVEKGAKDSKKGAELLVKSGLYENIFGKKFNDDFDLYKYVTKLSEFIYLLTRGISNDPGTLCKDMFKVTEISKQVSALDRLFKSNPKTDVQRRVAYHNLAKTAPEITDSKFVRMILGDTVDDFKNGHYPATLASLAVNGTDLKDSGVTPKKIGEILTELMLTIYKDKIPNEKSAILKYVKNSINV